MPLRRAVIVGTSRGRAWVAGDQVADGRPIRREDERIVSGIEHALECCIQALRAANRGDYLIGGDMNAVFSRQLFDQGLAQRKQAGRWRVVRLVFNQGPDGGELDVVGSLEEGLTAVQRMHLEPSARMAITLLRICTMSEKPTSSSRLASRIPLTFVAAIPISFPGRFVSSITEANKGF